MEAAQQALIAAWGEEARDKILQMSLSELYEALDRLDPAAEEEPLPRARP